MVDWLTPLIEIVKAINPAAIIAAGLSLGIVWKTFSLYTGLSERVSKIEGKLENLDELIRYKIKDELKNTVTKQIPKNKSEKAKSGGS